MIVGIPVMQLVLFGYAINLDLRGLPAAIADEAGTAGIARAGDGHARHRRDPTRARSRMRRRNSMAMLRRGADQHRRRRSRPTSSAAASTAAKRCRCWSTAAIPSVQSAALQLAQVPLDIARCRACGLQRRLGRTRRAESDQRASRFYNPERRTAVNIVPGLIGVILTMTMVLFTGVAIVRERERGNMELLIATPVSRSELMVGKVLPYAVDRPDPDHAGAGARRLAVRRAGARRRARRLRRGGRC